MRSIRLSLLIYFLGLLSLALGAASVLAYRTGQQTLTAKKQTTEKLIEAQYKDRCREEEQRLNKDLLAQAERLAAMVQPQILNVRPLNLFGIIGMDTVPGGYFLAPVWMAESIRPRGGPPGMPRPGGFNAIWDEMSRLRDYPLRTTVASIRFKDSDIDVLEHLDGQVAEFFQVDAEGYSRYRSQMLENPEEDIDRCLPLDLPAFAPDKPGHHEFNDVTVEPGLIVHRVILKTVPRHPFFRPGPRPSPSSAERDVTASESPRPDSTPTATDPPRLPRSDRSMNPRESRNSAVYIQCAFDKTRLLNAFQKFASRRDEELADLAQETTASLTALRNRLLLIGTLTFAAAVVGSFVLVWLGLVPLRRLSDAVSRVSPHACNCRSTRRECRSNCVRSSPG